MTLFVYYESSLTPLGLPFSVDVSSAVRLGSIQGISQEAEGGAVGEGSLILDDPNSDLGFFGDGIRGLKSWRMIETAAPVGNQLLFIGYVGSRIYRRNFSESLILGVEREIDVTLYDINMFLSHRVFAPTALDPTSDFVRPAETDLQRIAALLTTVDFLTDTLFDIGYIPTTGGVAMDAQDYTGSRPVDVLNDCAQASGRNFFVIYSEALTEPVLWYDVYSTDGSATIPYDSPLSLTNVASEANANATILLTVFPGDTIVTLAWSVVPGATTFIVDEGAEETIDPSRVVSAEYLTYTGGVSYRTLPGTAANFAWRDGQPLTSWVKSGTKADALADRYLADNATEDSRITCSVQLPASAVTLLNQGQRVQVHLTHCPSVASGMTWCRVLQRTIRMDHMTNDWYWLDLELSPLATVPFAPSITQNFDVWVNPPHVSFSNPGDPSKAGYVYMTAGLATDPVIADQYTLASTSPHLLNVGCNSDSILGNGTGISAGSNIMNDLYPHTPPGPGITFTFTAGVPQTFNVYVTYYAAGGLAYTDGHTVPQPSVHGAGSPTTPPNFTVSPIVASSTTTAPNGTLYIGGCTMTWTP